MSVLGQGDPVHKTLLTGFLKGKFMKNSFVLLSGKSLL